MEPRPTAAIIVIGDEILKGQVIDTNSHFLAKELYDAGVKVTRISVIGDETAEISKEIAEYSEKNTYVFTTGGIGPTHDDVTYEGVAKAFQEKLIVNKNLQDILRPLCSHFCLDETGLMKMSRIPKSAELNNVGNGKEWCQVPIVSVRNVFIFPGIPSYVQYAFKKLKKLYSHSVKFSSKNLYITLSEFEIVDILNETTTHFKDSVIIGSYEISSSEYYQVKLTLEGDTDKAVADAEAFLRSHLPPNCVVGQFPPDSHQSLQLFNYLINKPKTGGIFSNILSDSIDILKECFSKYSKDSIFLSFNGGKDCTALLHLTYNFLRNEFQNEEIKMKAFYVASKASFPEVEDFVYKCKTWYKLELLCYPPPIKSALFQLQKDNPGLKAVLLGSRSTDPNCENLHSFQPTDNDWPQFMRVNPLISWNYSHIWQFLRDCQVPYCSLYDRGYTSLGCSHNTQPNKHLLVETSDGHSYYLPAYLLKEHEHERKGRE